MSLLKIPKLVYDAFADSVNRIMEGPDREWRKPGQGQMNDFVSLAVAGECLRRLCQAHLEEDDGPQPYAFETLEKYDTFLSKYQGEYPYHVVDDFKEVLADLTRYGEQPREERDYEQGCQLLMELEQVLMIMVAGWRARRALDEQVVINCANQACTHIDSIANTLSDLYEFADDHESLNGSDPNFLNLYGFWENLADLAPSRRRFEQAVREAIKKEKRIEDAVARLDKKADEGTGSSGA